MCVDIDSLYREENVEGRQSLFSVTEEPHARKFFVMQLSSRCADVQTEILYRKQKNFQCGIICFIKRQVFNPIV